MLDKQIRSRVWRDDEDGKLYVGLNDLFAPAADAEEIPADQLAVVLDAWESHGWWGILSWVIQRRYVQPMRAAVQVVPPHAQEQVPPTKVLSPEHRAANEASFKQSGLDWCAHQMAYNWPRNEFGSLITEGEVEKLREGSAHTAASAERKD